MEATTQLTFSVSDRAAHGKALRAEAPRSSHAEFGPAAERHPVALLERQALTRIPELVPIRYGRMMVSPFAFYRGAAAIMAHDLASTPRSGIEVQCCGDAHLSNFGVFASPDRRLVFDINDFDETHPGPWEWDVKRLAASMVIAARDNGFGTKDQDRIVLATAGQYRVAMREFSAMGNLAVWYARIEVESLLREQAGAFPRTQVKRTKRELVKARTRDSMSAFSKLTTVVGGQPRIVDQSPLVVPVDRLVPAGEREAVFEELRRLANVYRESLDIDRRLLLDQFELIDFARKVVGVGSVGTRAWIALLVGRDITDPLFLQLKEAEASVLEQVLGAGRLANHGERVVTGQRVMQAASDICLGWLRVESPVDGESRDFYGRQLRDWKGSAEVDQMVPNGMVVYGRLCGWTLARAHARSGDRVAIGAYLGSSNRFDRAILEFSRAYADQNERDYEGLCAAVNAGRIRATTGV